MSNKKQTAKRWLEGGFKTFEEAERALHDMRQSAIARGLKPGEPLPPPVDAFCRWLFDGHPSRDELYAKGFSYFTYQVRGDGPRGNTSYAYVDAAGVVYSFSVATALRGQRRSRRAQVLLALRNEVRDQVQAVRDQALRAGARCPETGEVLTALNIELDHVGHSFSSIVQHFFGGTVLDSASLTKNEERLADANMSQAWRAYHAYYARLEPVSKTGHARRTKQRRTEDNDE